MESWSANQCKQMLGINSLIEYLFQIEVIQEWADDAVFSLNTLTVLKKLNCDAHTSALAWADTKSSHRWRKAQKVLSLPDTSWVFYFIVFICKYNCRITTLLLQAEDMTMRTRCLFWKQVISVCRKPVSVLQYSLSKLTAKGQEESHFVLVQYSLPS